MKIIIPVLVVLLVLVVPGCNGNSGLQKQAKNNPQITDTNIISEKPVETFDGETNVVLDTPSYKLFIVVKNTGLYSTDKKTGVLKDSLAKDVPVKGFYKSNGFIYVETKTSDAKQKNGWVSKDDISEMQFTPPIIRKNKLH